MVCCRHGEPNYLVLEFNRKPAEGEDAVGLFICKDKYPSKYRCQKGQERWIEQLCWFLFPRNLQQHGLNPRCCGC